MHRNFGNLGLLKHAIASQGYEVDLSSSQLNTSKNETQNDRTKL
jgi:hypothetical protein